MGNPKQKWTSEEEEALRKGVLKHGTGKWKDIQRDPEFNPYLLNRSNIDLKDKWRNLSCSANGQGPREKSRTPKPKINPDDPATQSTAPSQSAAAVAVTAPSNTDDSSKGLPDGKNSLMNNSMIFEAITSLKEPNGSDTSAIVSYIEQKHEVPQNFRRILSTRLRRLVAQDKLEKVNNYYKLKSSNGGGVSLVPKTPAPRVETPPRQLPITVPKITVDPLEEVAIAAALAVVDAEAKSNVAAEAVREVERIAAIAEWSDSMSKLAEEIYEKCLAAEAVEQAA